MKLDAIGLQIQEEKLAPLLRKSLIGLERETQRVKNTGVLSSTDHPESLGDRFKHPYIKTDFGESQMEFITPPIEGADNVINYLDAIQQVATQELDSDEQLWPLSSIPKLPVDESKVRIAHPDELGFIYRNKLAEKYGKKRQLFTSVHLNFSFPEKVIQILFDSEFHSYFNSYIEFHNYVYLKIGRKFMEKSWLTTYLFGATPIVESTNYNACHPVRSVRNSEFGYTNIDSSVQASYRSINSYVTSLNKMVQDGKLLSFSEYYGDVQFKSATKKEDTLISSGVNYIELRGFDVDPFSRVGIQGDTIKFIQLLAAYFLMTPDMAENEVDDIIFKAKQLKNEVAIEDPKTTSIVKNAAIKLLNELILFNDNFYLDKSLEDTLVQFKLQFERPELSLSARIVDEDINKSLADFAMEQAKSNKIKYQSQLSSLIGFNCYSKNTQLILAALIKRGSYFDLVDSDLDVIRVNGHLLQNGVISDLDTSVLNKIAYDKQTTKKILGNLDIKVPSSINVHTLDEAMNYYADVVNKALVIKPRFIKSSQATHVFRVAPTLSEYKEAVKRILSIDTQVLIEEITVGSVYRFMIVDGRVKGIVERLPVSVVGDGRKTLAQLITIKNRQVERTSQGPWYPLKLSEVENQTIASQGITESTVISRGSEAIIRYDSNFYSGANQNEVSNQMDESYIALIEGYAKRLKMTMGAFDVVIPNLYIAYDHRHRDALTVLSIETAPDLSINSFPNFGDNQPIANEIVKILETK
ncbi:bifunctional glutamate--cysteine ligase GshA/glutathione synthetase GshB [Dellaglioa sp. P0083]|uniref:bifunctional glutamate--cysteine ligase GshA/glutathione synthetase GshB n=1 Tax=Dellaglioa kimchii TaxID=3344667 RepID=UPI0038D449EA